MIVSRTKRLTLKRAFTILQLRFGTQVRSIIKNGKSYITNEICTGQSIFTRADILNYEDEIYSNIGC